MQKIALLAVMATMGFAPHNAVADSYIIGAGRWSCADAIQVADSGTDSQKGQLGGWVFGYWSAVTTQKPTEFVDIVENAGGERILNLTIQACRDAPPETLIYQITDSLIRNTG